MLFVGVSALSPGLPRRPSGRLGAAAPAALPAQDAGALRRGGGGTESMHNCPLLIVWWLNAILRWDVSVI